MTYSYKNAKNQTYYLYSRDVVLKGSKKNQRIFFFSKKMESDALDAIPEGYEIVENKKTGLPVLRRK